MCSGFFCTFALPFSCLVVSNNLRGFCFIMFKGSIFLSVQILSHLRLSSVILIFHGLTRLKKRVMCYSLHIIFPNGFFAQGMMCGGCAALVADQYKCLLQSHTASFAHGVCCKRRWLQHCSTPCIRGNHSRKNKLTR